MVSRTFERELENAWPAKKWHDVRTLIAVSAGADSVALLRASLANSQNENLLTVAHFNHGLRGAESDEDQRFVRELCDSMGVEVRTEKASRQSIHEERPRIGVESAARNARYEFLKSTAEAIGARYILTAHTADDQAETVLHNICRGTGLHGVAGIPFARAITEAVTVIRPLLHVTRNQVIGYLDEIKQAFRTDSSNSSSEFTRNRLRNEILPQLEKRVNSATKKHLCQLAEIARESVQYLDVAAEDLQGVITIQSENAVCINCDRTAGVSELLLVHFLKRLWSDQGWGERGFDATRWRRIAATIQSSLPAVGSLPGGIKFERQSGEMRFFKTK